MLRTSIGENCCGRSPPKLLEEPCGAVDVAAPTCLEEGYIFWATWEDLSFPVKVPVGGVQMGQTLRVPLLESRAKKHKGKWKDGIFSCFRLGLCHPTVCNAWACPQILLGQILTRLKMSWLATPSVGRSPSVVQKCFGLLVLVSVHDVLVAPPPIQSSVDDADAVFLWQSSVQMLYQAIYLLMSFISTIYGVLVVVKLRAAVRMKYGIPTGRLGRLEDLVYVFCCNCCVMSQLARQTADYDTNPAMCCSPTGTAQPPADDIDEEDGLLPATTL